MRCEADGESCTACGFWIQATGDWFCEECGYSTCERCGRDCEDLFLCPDCFLKEGSSVKSKPLVYLAGAMEKAGPFGAAWREEITPYLEDLGYKVWNPYKEEINAGITVGELSRLKITDFPAYKKHCENIIDYDLSQLVDCSLVVCLLDWAVQLGAGTYGELTVCRLHKIPVYAWINRRKGEKGIPGWALGCLTEYVTTKEDFYKLIPPAEEIKKL